MFLFYRELKRLLRPTQIKTQKKSKSQKKRACNEIEKIKQQLQMVSLTDLTCWTKMN